MSEWGLYWELNSLMPHHQELLMQLLKTTAVAVASCPWCTALVSALRKKQCTSLYWDIRPPSQQQYSCSFEGQRNKEFLSLLGLSGPLRSLSLRSFNYLWWRREKILSHTLTWTHTHIHTHLLQSTGLKTQTCTTQKWQCFVLQDTAADAVTGR